ncbi:MAG: hypothetical protein RJA70_2046 [Pseudomonadota bacterium]|jgi:hypothetical protein
MSTPTVFNLQSVRTDGWFERIAESVGSFQALCDILGEKFFAFSLITGARITALTVDRRNPDESLVDFEVAGAEDSQDSQRLTLGRFRQRLVSALIAEEPNGPPPQRDTDVEAMQLHIGVRYLLLAPLYGYQLELLSCSPQESLLTLIQEGEPVEVALDEFRRLMRSQVLDELDRVAEDGSRGQGIDFSQIPEAESAASRGDHQRVIEILGSWAGPLTILLRTPDGQMLGADTRGLLSTALLLLGTSLVACAEPAQGEDILRLAVQYAVDTPKAAQAYAGLGAALILEQRYGEAIATLRRAANLGADPKDVWPKLALAFLEQGRVLAAFGAAEEGLAKGVSDPTLRAVRAQALDRLPAFPAWAEHCASASRA